MFISFNWCHNIYFTAIINIFFSKILDSPNFKIHIKSSDISIVLYCIINLNFYSVIFMSDEKRAQVKRAILAELNKELSKTTKTLSKGTSKGKHHASKAKHVDLALVPRTTSAKLHRPITVKGKFDAQKFADNVANKAKLASAGDGPKHSTTIKKNVYIPQPTPRIEHDPPSSPPNPIAKKYAGLWLNITFGKDRTAFHKATVLHKSKLEMCLYVNFTISNTWIILLMRLEFSKSRTNRSFSKRI